MEIPVQKEAWRERVKQDGGVIPATGFPRVDGMATGTCKKHVRHVANASISCNICIRPQAVVLGGIPSKHAYSERNDSVRCRGSRRSRNGRSGSSGTRFGEGLDEPNIYRATVVVHGRRGTWHHIVWSYTFRTCSCRQCRGTWGLAGLGSCDGSGSRRVVEVVVHDGEELGISATRVFGDGSCACSNIKLGGTPTSWYLVNPEDGT